MLEKIIADLLSNIDKRDFGTSNKIFFFKELGYLLGGGVGIMDSISLINHNTSNYALKEITKDIKNYVGQGKTLAYALSRQSQYFSGSDVAIVRAGEKSGKLVDTLTSLAQEYQFLKKIYNQYVSALIYPIILIVIAIGAIISLFAFVLPGIFSISEQFENLQLPLTTTILKNISEFAVGNRYSILGTIIITVTACVVFFSTKSGQSLLLRFLLQMPVVGKITQYYYLIKFTRYMKMMSIAGMNYLDTFKLLKEIMNVSIYETMIEKVLEGLKKGERIYDNIKYESELIPTSAAALIKVGEETANMVNTLDNINAIYDDELQSNITNLSKVIEPVMLVFIGGIIIVIALGVFGVITNIMDAIQV